MDGVLRVLAVIAVCMPAVYSQATGQDTTVYRVPAVVVSVTRIPIRVLDVPMAISLVPARMFAGSNGARVDAALRNTPGVLAQSRSGGVDVRIVVRGFGARGAGDRSNAGTTRGLRIMQDGFPETEPDGRTALDLLDLAAIEHVEIVRSNASALWGNAGGGLINFSSVPDAHTPPLRVGFQADAFGMRRGTARFNYDVDNAQFYGTITHTDLAGWRANSAGERSLANLGVITQLSSATRFRAHAVAADNTMQIPGPLTLAELVADPTQANATYRQRRERRHNRLGRLGVGLDHDLNKQQSLSATLFVNPKYLQRSERGTFRDFTRYHFGGSALFRATHGLGATTRGSLIVGVDDAYQDGAILFYSLTADGERGTIVRDNKREGANNFGLFGQETLSFGSKLDLTLGLRYDNVSYYYDSYINPKLDARKSFEHVTPKIGLLYRLSPNHTFYANVGGGVEVPAGNETEPIGTFGTDTITAINPLLEPIHSTTLEVGTKQIRTYTSGFLRGLSYDVALYHTRVTNEIVPYRGGRFYFTAARAKRSGAELGVAAATAPGIDVRTSFTFSDNRYDNYQVDSVHYGRPGQIADFSDNHIVGLPGQFFTVSLQYGPSQLGGLGIEFELERVGRFFADDANTVDVPGYTLLHAGLNLRRPIRLGSFNVNGSVRAENLTDEDYVASAFLNPDFVNGVPVAFESGLPRHLVLSVSVGL